MSMGICLSLPSSAGVTGALSMGAGALHSGLMFVQQALSLPSHFPGP